MWRLKSSRPGFLRVLMSVYNLMVIRRIAPVKYTACVTMSDRFFEGALTKLDVSLVGSGHGEYMVFPSGWQPTSVIVKYDDHARCI